MGWKGTLNSLAAAQRRAEREARRRQRELERQRTQLEKMEELERAAFEAEEFENYLDVLMSIHKDCGPTWNWAEIQQAPPPQEPQRSRAREVGAKAAHESFTPGISDKLLRRSDKKRDALRAAIDEAIADDERKHEEEMEQYRADLADWEEQKALASRILAREPAAFVEAIEAIGPFSELSALGSSINFSCEDPTLIEATLLPHGEDVIPKEAKSLLKSGRLSVKNMPKTRFYELYQDYACGSALRVARELFALLPIEMSIVTEVTPMLNTQTGHMEDQPMLSVAIPRRTFKGLNFELLDPSDSLGNFVHNMQFQKTKGFSPVERIAPSSLASSA